MRRISFARTVLSDLASLYIPILAHSGIMLNSRMHSGVHCQNHRLGVGPVMKQKSPRLPRLNLAKYQATSVFIQGWHDPSDVTPTVLQHEINKDPSPADDVGVTHQWLYSTRDGAEHSVSACIGPGGGQPGQIVFWIRYRFPARLFTPIGKEARSQAEFLRLATALGAPARATGTVDFRFKRVDQASLWFPLPTKLAGKSGDVDIEVRGVRGVRPACDEHPFGYSFILERPASRDVFATITVGLSRCW